jgi:hypothetical protein
MKIKVIAEVWRLRFKKLKSEVIIKHKMKNVKHWKSREKFKRMILEHLDEKSRGEDDSTQKDKG